MTIVVHLRDGGRRVSQGDPTPRICIPVSLMSARTVQEQLLEISRHNPLLEMARLEPRRFSREFYRLLDIREVAGEEVATYVFDPTPEPEIVYTDVPPGRLTFWERFLMWFHRIMDLQRG